MPRLAPVWVALGIDGGAKGGVAAIARWADGRTTHAVLPCDTRIARDVRGAIKTLVPWKGVSVLAGVEKGQPFPGRGVKTLWAVAQSYFTTLAVLDLRRTAYVLVPSQTWQKVALVGRKRARRSSMTSKQRHAEYKAHKESLIAACEARWPRALDGLNKGSRSGCADALFLADHVARIHLGGSDAVLRRQGGGARRREEATP